MSTRQTRARRNAFSVVPEPCLAVPPPTIATLHEEVLVCPFARADGVGCRASTCTTPGVSHCRSVRTYTDSHPLTVSVDPDGIQTTLANFSFGADPARREFRLVGMRWQPDRHGGMRRVWCAHCAGSKA